MIFYQYLFSNLHAKLVFGKYDLDFYFIWFISENLEVSAQQVESILSSLDQSQLNVTTTTVITGNYFDELMPTALNRAWSKAAQHTVSRLQPKCQHYVINGADHRMIYNQHVQELSAPIIRIIKRIKHSLSTK